MSTPAKKKKAASPGREVKPADIWNAEKMNQVRAFISEESKKLTPEQKLRNRLLAIRYQMQDYVEQEKVEREMLILDFVKLYLKQLNMSQKDLATGFEMRDSNLYKYLTGERKLNPDIVLKLSAFSHTPPEMWYRIQIKNELDELRKEKDKLRKYKKYDYRKLISA